MVNRRTAVQATARVNRRKPVWVCRSKYEQHGVDEYFVFKTRKDALAHKATDDGGSVFWDAGRAFESHNVDELFGLFLEPGTGPVKVQFTAELV